MNIVKIQVHPDGCKRNKLRASHAELILTGLLYKYKHKGRLAYEPTEGYQLHPVHVVHFHNVLAKRNFLQLLHDLDLLWYGTLSWDTVENKITQEA